MTDSLSNIPIFSNGAVIGLGEIKDDVLTIALKRGYGANYIDYMQMGLLTGFSFTPVHAETTHAIHEVDLIHDIPEEHNNA